MATIEERLTAIEQEHAEFKHDNAELKQKIELQTMAIGGLVNKAMLERINEKNDKIFQTLQNHDKFTNQQLAELREKLEVDIEGKIVGMQAEMRQRFETVATKDDLNAVNARLGTMATKDDLNAVNARLGTMATKDDLNAMNTRFDQIMVLLTALAPKPEQEK